MAQTVVKDSQLRLDPIISQDFRIDKSTPILTLDDSGEPGGSGLFRFKDDNNELRIQHNTSVGRDFSTLSEILLLDGSNFQVLQPLQLSGISNKARLVFSVTVTGASASANNLYREASDNRLTYKDNSSVAHTLMYRDNQVTRETPVGDLDGVDVTYVLANTPVSGTEHVYLNGILQDEGAGNDYIISAATITFAVAPISTDKIRASYIK